MKHFTIAVIAAAALFLPAAVVAGEGRAPIGPFVGLGVAQNLGLSQQQQQAMMQVWGSAHTRMRQMHADARNQILAVLTPAQRSLLASVVGNLAIAANPNQDAAAQQIQAALTPAQSQRILGLHSALEQQAHQVMTTAMTQAQALLTQQQKQKLQQEMSAHMSMNHPGMRYERTGTATFYHHFGEDENPQTEAGHVLLFMALHGNEGFGSLPGMEHERP